MMLIVIGAVAGASVALTAAILVAGIKGCPYCGDLIGLPKNRRKR